MATQDKSSQSSKSIDPAIYGFALFILVAHPVNKAAVQLSHFLCAVAGDLLRVLPSISCHGFEAHALSHGRLIASFHMLVSSWRLLHMVVGAG